MRTRILLTAVLGALTIAFAGPVEAATVSLPFRYHVAPDPHRGGGEADTYDFSLVAGPGEANRLTVEQEDGFHVLIRVRDTGASLTPGANCRADGDAVVCEGSRSYANSILDSRIDLGDGDDELALEGLYTRIAAGPGADRVTSDKTHLHVDGGRGPDTVRAPGGSVTYAGRAIGVIVTPDGVANDGEPGEGDDVGPLIGNITGGNGDDELHLDMPGEELREGIHLTGGAGSDRLIGGGDSEVLDGGPGDDALVGNGGMDQLAGGRGADFVRGGDGRDMVGYGGATGVDVTLDDRGGDGLPGENDDIGSDIEVVSGTDGDDRLVGSAIGNLLTGRGGDDHLDGGGGADQLHDDAGRNRLVGGSGPDEIEALGLGDSVVEAADGEVDRVRCGFRTGLSLDPFDTVTDCAPKLTGPEGARIRAGRDGLVRVRVSCLPGIGKRCEGKLLLHDLSRTGDGAPMARARIRVAAGQKARIELKLTRAARSRLATHRVLRVYALWQTRSSSPPSRSLGRFDFKLLRPR